MGSAVNIMCVRACEICLKRRSHQHTQFPFSKFQLQSTQVIFHTSFISKAACTCKGISISACYTRSLETITWQQKAIRHQFLMLLWCAASLLCCTQKNSHEGLWLSEIYWCGNLTKFSRAFSTFISPAACRCQSRLPACAASTHVGIQSNLHLPQLGYSRRFHSVVSPIPFFFKALFSAVSSTYYF